MNIICLGQQHWDYCWTGKQQLMTRLAARGHRVLYINPDWVMEPPRRGPTVDARAGGLYSTRTIQPGLLVFSYHYARWLPGRVNAALLTRSVAAACRRYGLDHPALFVIRPDRAFLAGRLSPSAALYWASDDWTGFGGLSENQRDVLRAAEAAVLRQADVALGISPLLVKRLAAEHAHVHELPSAADIAHFSPDHLARVTPDERLLTLPRPRIGYVGQVDERVDQDLVIALARRHPEWAIVFAGRVKEGADVSRLAAEPNIHLLGFVPYEQLPAVLREVDVCLAPYRLTPLTHACSPLKVYEYLATGRPVVATRVDGLRPCQDVVSFADDAESFVRAVEQAVRQPEVGRAARLQRAADNSWDRRTDQLENYLEEAGQLRRARQGRPPGDLVRLQPGLERMLQLDAKDQADRDLRNLEHTAPRRAVRMYYPLARSIGAAYYALRVLGRLSRGQRDWRVRKILVVRKAYLGDLIVFLPALQALRRRYPQAHITLGVQPDFSAKALLEPAGLVDEVRVLDALDQPTRLKRLQALLKLLRQGYDLAITGVSYFLLPEAFLTGAPRCVALYDGHPQHALALRVLPLDPIAHEGENSSDLMAALGAPADDLQRIPRLALPEAKLAEQTAQLLARLGLPANAVLVTMHPGSKRPSRRWPAERFAELAQALLRAHPELWIAFTGTGDEADLVADIRASIAPAERGRALDTIGQTTLLSLVGLLDRSRLVVSNDTGVMHLARARGRPLLALLGPENDRRWGPYPVGTSPATALRVVVPCSPCVRWDCEFLFCMRSLSVQQVRAEAERMLIDETGLADGATATIPRPVERHFARKNFSELDAAGLPVPEITIAILAPRQNDGVIAALARSVASAEGQDYPHCQIIITAPDSAEASRLAQAFPNIQVIAADGARPAGVQSLLVAARGVYVLLLPAGQALPRTGVSARAAALVRTEAALAADGQRVYDWRYIHQNGIVQPAKAPRQGGEAAPPTLMVRRTVLEAQCGQVSESAMQSAEA